MTLNDISLLPSWHINCFFPASSLKTQYANSESFANCDSSLQGLQVKSLVVVVVVVVVVAFDAIWKNSKGWCQDQRPGRGLLPGVLSSAFLHRRKNRWHNTHFWSFLYHSDSQKVRTVSRFQHQRSRIKSHQEHVKIFSNVKSYTQNTTPKTEQTKTWKSLEKIRPGGSAKHIEAFLQLASGFSGHTSADQRRQSVFSKKMWKFRKKIEHRYNLIQFIAWLLWWFLQSINWLCFLKKMSRRRIWFWPKMSPKSLA